MALGGKKALLQRLSYFKRRIQKNFVNTTSLCMRVENRTHGLVFFLDVVGVGWGGAGMELAKNTKVHLQN